VSEAKVFENWDFHNSYDTLLSIWLEMLNHLRDTATQQPGWLQNGQWSYNGNTVAAWNVNYDASLGAFTINNDPYQLTDTPRQRDFGKLYEIGRELHKLNGLIKGGTNSVLTKAALAAIDDRAAKSQKSIDDDYNEKKKQLDSDLEAATADAVAKIKSVEASKDWSEHYETRCKELVKIIDGSGKKKAHWFSRRDGLKAARDRWYWVLVCTFVVYAIVALLIVHGIWIFKIGSSLDATLSGFGKYFIGLTLYGALAGIYIGYGFSVKQLKVHQNLLEQYRHRAIVAKTIEGIVLAVIKTKEGTSGPGEESQIRDEDLEQLVKVAAASMFEYRPIGHLSTREGTSILNDIIGRSN
jgi:hypothetical protein